MKPYYEIDTETANLLEAMLHMCSHIADLQADEQSQDDIYSGLAELAERFGIDPDPWKSEPEPENSVTAFRPFTIVVDNDKPKSDS